jgi:hypothetical protein
MLHRIIIAALFCVPALAFAEGGGVLQKAKDLLGPTLSLRTAYWSDDTQFTKDHHFWVGSAWLTLRPQEFEGFRIYADGYVQAEDLARNIRTVADLREAYVDRSFAFIDIRGGRQIMVWGRADKLNPTDQLSVRDFRRLFVDDEDQRTGLAALDVTANAGDYRLKGVWVPEWRDPGLPLPDVGGGIRWIFQEPDQPLEQFALKLDHTGSGGFDASMSFFHGYSKVPDIAPLAKVGGIDLAVKFPLINVLGADFAWSVGDWGLRGESAFTRTDNVRGDDPYAQKPSLFSVLGVERTLIENFTVNAQYLNRWVSHYNDPTSYGNPAVALVATQSMITSQQMVRMNHGLSLRPSYKILNDTLEMEVALVRWFVTKEQIFRPKVSYAITDQIKVIAGAQIFSGRPLSFFGRLNGTEAAYVEIKATY